MFVWNCKRTVRTGVYFGKYASYNQLFICHNRNLNSKSAGYSYISEKVVKKTHAHRDTDANIPHFYCLVISSVILFAGFLIANINTPAFKLVSPMYFGVSSAMIIISLWLITIKHKVLSNVIGFITMENGIFLLSLSVAKEMPIIVNLGVLLDIFIAVFILGMLVKEINNEFDDLEVSQLSDLKDYEYND